MVFRKLLWSLTVENSFDREKNLFVENFLVYRKFPWSRKKFLCGNLPFLWKFYLIMVKVSFEKNFLVCWKFPWSQKNSLFIGNALVCGKFCWSWKKFCLSKTFLFPKNFLDEKSLFQKVFLITEEFLSRKNFFDHRKICVCGKIFWLYKK